MPLMDEATKKELKKFFEENLNNEIEIIGFSDKNNNKEWSDIMEELLKEMNEVDNRIKYEIIDSNSEEGKKKLEELNLLLDKWGNKKGPIIIFKKYPNIVFYGVPGGEEFPVFLEDIVHVATDHFHLPLEAAKNIKKIEDKVDIYVFITLTCPYCPLMTHAAHQFAMINKNVRGIMIMAEGFNEFAEAYNVYAVPRNVIYVNGKKALEFEGAVPETTFAKKILEAIEKSK